MHTLFTGHRERERERERKREREGERKRKREKERERERVKEIGMMRALAPFSYLINIIITHAD
jgi:hypothetical protein